MLPVLCFIFAQWASKKLLVPYRFQFPVYVATLADLPNIQVASAMQ